MARIEVKRDPQIKLEPIVHALRQPSPEEIGEDPGNPTEIQQTKVFGLIVPILALNGVAVDFQDVETFELDYTAELRASKPRFVTGRTSSRIIVILATTMSSVCKSCRHSITHIKRSTSHLCARKCK